MTDIFTYLLTFWFGLMMGFGLFAMLQVSREEDERPLPLSDEHRYAMGC
jgi:NAD(P)H-flavin reductase